MSRRTTRSEPLHGRRVRISTSGLTIMRAQIETVGEYRLGLTSGPSTPTSLIRTSAAPEAKTRQGAASMIQHACSIRPSEPLPASSQDGGPRKGSARAGFSQSAAQQGRCSTTIRSTDTRSCRSLPTIRLACCTRLPRRLRSSKFVLLLRQDRHASGSGRRRLLCFRGRTVRRSSIERGGIRYVMRSWRRSGNDPIVAAQMHA